MPALSKFGKANRYAVLAGLAGIAVSVVFDYFCAPNPFVVPLFLASCGLWAISVTIGLASAALGRYRDRGKNST